MLLNKISVRWSHRILSPSAITFLILETRPYTAPSFNAPTPQARSLPQAQSSPVKKDLFILS